MFDPGKVLSKIKEKPMREFSIRKSPLHEPSEREDLKGKTPGELMGMVWQLTLDAWSFKENVDAEPAFQRHIVVFKKRER
jgi:hypothetical protein